MIVRKTALMEGTSHHMFSDLDEPEAWTTSIHWRSVCVVDAAADFPSVYDVVAHLKDCPQHQVSFPTLRYTPAHFMYWPEYKIVNDHIRCRSSELSWPTLNLSCSFMMRQGATWVVSV